MAYDGVDRPSVAGTEVVGVGVDGEALCAHYATDCDVLAIAFPCCGTFYPRFRCHVAVADHDPETWPVSARDERALLCGACGNRFTVEAYLDSPLACAECDAAFNPGCRDHHDRYFEVEPGGP